jgi:hypothetical protein
VGSSPGIDAPVLIVGVLLIVGSIGTLGALGMRRRPRPR